MKHVGGIVTLVTAVAFIATLASVPTTTATPIKFMCDMCETNFLRCMLNCHMEEYMTRHMYNNNQVYMGKPAVPPKKNMLDKMLTHMMHMNGHNHVLE